MKVQSRKIFTHRESFDTIIAKTEEKLQKVGAFESKQHMRQTFVGKVREHNPAPAALA